MKTSGEKRAYMREYAARPETRARHNARSLANYHAMTPEQKAARLAKERARYAANRDKILAQRKKHEHKRREWNRLYVANNREKYYEYQAASRFKVKRSVIQALRASTSVCQICEQPPGKKRLAIDHDHATGVLRGMLCHTCNLGLGAFKDDPILLRNAFEYLMKHAEAQEVA